jgi:hypothetical protein
MKRKKLSLPRFKKLLRKRRQKLSAQLQAASRAAHALRGEAPRANWDESKTRYYFIDNENGGDSKKGYIDAFPGAVFSDAQIAKVALKTNEELRNRIPLKGNNRTMVVSMRARSDSAAYLDKSGNPDFLGVNYSGYEAIRFSGGSVS